VINVDDDHGAELARTTTRPVFTCSLSSGADFTAEDVHLTLDGTRFRARTPAGTFDVQTPLLGRFNVLNGLCAFGSGLALGLPPDAVQRGIASLKGVPGRIERVDVGQDFIVLVDYAHTDDALKSLLETVRELGPRRLVTVFGCGGDRDRSKRPLMGAVAARLSDVVILTSDNPRSEPPEAIIEDVRRGIPPARADETEMIVDRREAIARALELGREGVVIVIAGKGHETYQVLRDRRVPFDDRQVVREVLARPAGAGGKR
jgi:UDP-N-acetylmuramoyl-L-alanyl-D-glutamate--2,6-diaminopimelate ligase